MKNLKKKSQSTNSAKSRLRAAVKIVIILVTLLILLALFIVGMFLFAKLTQVSQAEANKVCQAFFEQVKADITAVPGYTIITGNKSCRPNKDEAGFTDYYFDATFRVAKAGGDSIEGLKANINHLADAFPGNTYPIQVDNAPGKNGQPATICVNATKQIQENGDEYQPSPPKHYPRYIEPSEFGSGGNGFTSSCADL